MSQEVLCIGDLLGKADPASKQVISSYRLKADHKTNIKLLSVHNVPQLNKCAAFLHIETLTHDKRKKYTKDPLIDKIVLMIETYLPAMCQKCNDSYTIEYDGPLPKVRCYMCFMGAHPGCNDNTTAGSNTTVGSIWICNACYIVHNPDYNPDNPENPQELTLDNTCEEELPEEVSQNSLDPIPIVINSNEVNITPPSHIESTHNPDCETTNHEGTEYDDEYRDCIEPDLQTQSIGVIEGDNIEYVADDNRRISTYSNTTTPTYNTTTTCPLYKVGKCPHGLSGKTEHEGQICSPKIVQIFL